jgi:hypothetical protein
VEAGQLREGVALGGQAHAAAVAILERHLADITDRDGAGDRCAQADIAGGDTGVTPLTGR